MSPSKSNRKTIVAAIVLIALVLGGVGYYSGFFDRLTGLTVVSISQILVDPQGYAVGNEWTGSFWNMLVSVQANDNVAGVILPKDQTGTVTVNNVQTALKTNAKIEIKVDPQPAYLIRNLNEYTTQVTPDVGQTWMNRYDALNRGEELNDPARKATALNLNYYNWAEPTFRIYTPYIVTIFKDGVQVGQATLNTEGKSSVQTINTGEGSVRIENLGILGGNYLAPNTPAQMAIFKGYPNMYDLTQVQGLIGYDR